MRIRLEPIECITKSELVVIAKSRKIKLIKAPKIYVKAN